MILCKVGPSSLKAGQIILKAGDYIVFIQVIHLKLLDDNENKQIEHDEGAEHHQGNKENWSVCNSACLIRYASIISCAHRILHNEVPVLPSAHSDHH